MGARIFVGILCLCGTFLLGVYVGFENRPGSQKVIGLINKENAAIADTADFEPFWKAWALVNEKFPGAEKITTKELKETFLKSWKYGWLSGLKFSRSLIVLCSLNPISSLGFSPIIHISADFFPSI